jgi:hypothetical protein
MQIACLVSQPGKHLENKVSSQNYILYRHAILARRTVIMSGCKAIPPVYDKGLESLCLYLKEIEI